MTIQSKLSQNDYINASLMLMYSRLPIQIVSAMILVVMLFTTYLTITHPQEAEVTHLILPTVLFIILPLLTVLTAIRNYKSNKLVGERLSYDFTQQSILIHGETFRAEIPWKKVKTITRTRNWLIIWQHERLANPISMREVTEEQIRELKIILDQVSIPNKL